MKLDVKKIDPVNHSNLISEFIQMELINSVDYV